MNPQQLGALVRMGATWIHRLYKAGTGLGLGGLRVVADGTDEDVAIHLQAIADELRGVADEIGAVVSGLKPKV